ncbi:MAG: 50S ribosomal protein L14e [archaeon]|nr:50S ribosomal protein L14e [archaeon]
MSALTVGRVCVKVAGKNSAKYCVIIDVIDDSFVEVTGPKSLTGVKKGRCNILHIEPTKDMIKIDAKADDADVLKAVDKENLADKMKSGIKL